MHLSSTTAAAAVCFLAATAVHAIPHYPRTQGDNSIKWTPCKLGNTTVPMECGSLTVPLDYTDKTSNATLQLQLQRAPAKKPCKDTKSILLNFGGPGADGILDFVYFSERMQAATGGGHHLINLVPRGTNTTLPFSCYQNDLLRNSNQPLAGNASNVALGFVWERAAFVGVDCKAAQNKTGSLIGTAFVARDMMRVVDALGEDGMLRYWGVSYGTILGATAVAMFPDRVDKILLDGVVNPFEYYENKETELFTDSDAAFRGFMKGCLANPELCPLAKNQTLSQLEDSIYSLFERLKSKPIGMSIPGYPGGGIMIDYSLVTSIVYRQLYTPFIWQTTAKCLNGLLSGNKTDAQRCLGGLDAPPANVRADQEALQGIKCGDNRVHTANLTDMLPVFEGRHQKSRYFGSSADIVPATCAQWTMPAKERYMGDFNVTPRKPVLVIGNTYDPITPLVSARNVSETFKGSVLLQHDAYGHDSLMQASLCTAKAIRSYFSNGIMPEQGTKCGNEVALFSSEDGWDNVIKQLEESS
ncbi:nedd8-conjugating enzyme UBE2F [Conoideocrella luteorostrata]|uniref:Nedd8-conjugating enzyme UBE2F n=1 Tax=Conoideocrella luteorostrata TaxID=1105319 RepID=A0AAJ0CGN8_9HYPO|nr:nedd8-conjugating enzyme UBE2F [Conoideocrella luteorostrata]